ncbi:MAG: TonB-dependent receptor [Dysgonamonadaceae bacterium]|jgi:TonB-linked SusC/RagA family outer membrane protein|nr:TonB-dependent receptor [Dysgonamonadaceae bacterium]
MKKKPKVRTVFLKSGLKKLYKVLTLCVITLSVIHQANAQITVTGIVTDASLKETLPGASVTIKGTNQGMAADMNGRYSIVVPNKQSVLVFSLIGYTTREIIVGNQQEINVALKEQETELDGVVVMGYWTTKKRDNTGAISSINDKLIAEKQAVTIFDALKGASSGVQILSNSGAPGSDVSIRVRGASTMSDSGVNPLYIVDGVQTSDISFVNPDDIKSMEILKDAASASIYGSRSANGVVIITTKRGEVGKPRVDIKYLNSYSSMAHKISQANRLEREIFDRSNATRGMESLGLAPYPNDSTAFNRNADNDYQDLMTRTAVRNQIDLSLSGGTDALRYRGSVQYLDDQGIILNTFYKRLGGRFNVNYFATKKLTFNTQFNFSYTDKNNTNEGKVIQQAMQRPPQMTLYFPDGSWMYDNGGRKNPVAEAYLRKNETAQYRGTIYQDMDYKFTDWLKLHGNIAVNFGLDDTETFNSKLLETATPPLNSGSSTSRLSLYTQGDLSLTADKQFGNHHLQGIVGGVFENSDVKNIKISGRNFSTELITTLNVAGELLPADTYTDGTANSLAGFYGRFGYNYKSRYLLNATLRADGSSRFGKDNRWGYFPSLSVAWRFSDELPTTWNLDWLADGKLRASYGVTGNQAIGNYEAQTEFVLGSYAYNGKSGVRTSTKMGNTLLKWESTTQNNVGIDLMFLDGALSFVGDYYVKNTKDLLYDAELPLEIGYSSGVRTNLGELQNKGIELMLTWHVFDKRDYAWSTTFSWTTNKNKIVYLPGGDRVDGIWWIGAGSAVGTFYGWKQLGIYDYSESNAWTSDFKQRLTPVFAKDEYGNVILDKQRNPTVSGYQLPDGTAYAGDVKRQTSAGTVLGAGDVIWQELADEKGAVNGDVGNEDRQTLGNAQPSWYAGWQNTARYKDFALSFSFYASVGGLVYNENNRNRALFATTNVTPDPYFVYNMWKYPGQHTDVYRRGNYTYNTRRGGSYFLEEATFIRLQNVRLSYNLKKSWVKAAHLANAQLYIYGNNLLTWTNYSGFDPEVNQTSVLKPGDDTGRYPRKKELGFGINVAF